MPNYMIRDTLDRLRDRLQEIPKEKYEVAKELKAAAAFGDFSENAEYDVAKEKKEMLALEELRLKEWLSDVQLIEELQLPEDQVTVGKKLRIKDLDTGEEQVFVILGEHDKYPGFEVVSITSPLAAVLLNKKQGRSVEVRLPRMTRRYKILEVHKLFE